MAGLRDLFLTPSREEQDRITKERKEKGKEELRTLAMLAQRAAVGTATAPYDLLALFANSPTYLANALGSNAEAPIPYGAPAVNEFLNQYTGLEARTPTQEVLGRAAEFTNPALGLPKALRPQTLKDYFALASAGAGSELGHQANPESPIAPLVGGLAGAFAPSAVAKSASVGKSAIEAGKGLLPEQFAKNQLKGINPEIALENQAAAKRIGTSLTPAEASENPIIAAREGRLGKTEQNKLALYEQKAEREKGHQEQIQNFFNKVSNSPESNLSVDEIIRKSAQGIIKDKEQALQAKASPYYKNAETIAIDADKINALNKSDPTVRKAIDSVLKDSTYAAELEGFEQNSTKVLDLAKRHIDDQISAAQRAGEKNKVRLLKASNDRLVKTIDAENPNYKAARAIYSEDLPAIQDLKKSELGKIADIKDISTKRIGNIIFDRTQTNPKAFGEIQNEIYTKDPNAWNALVRQQMENKIGSVEQGASNFYNKVLKNPKDFRMFHEALKSNPEAQSVLGDMRKVYKNLLNPVTVKTAAGQAKSSLDVPRSSLQFAKDTIASFTGGKADKAAIDLITNPKWTEKLTEVANIKSAPERIKTLGATIKAIEQTMQTEKKTKDEEYQAELLIDPFEELSLDELKALRNQPDFNYEDIEEDPFAQMSLDEMKALLNSQ